MWSPAPMTACPWPKASDRSSIGHQLLNHEFRSACSRKSLAYIRYRQPRNLPGLHRFNDPVRRIQQYRVKLSAIEPRKHFLGNECIYDRIRDHLDSCRRHCGQVWAEKNLYVRCWTLCPGIVPLRGRPQYLHADSCTCTSGAWGGIIGALFFSAHPGSFPAFETITSDQRMGCCRCLGRRHRTCLRNLYRGLAGIGMGVLHQHSRGSVLPAKGCENAS